MHIILIRIMDLHYNTPPGLPCSPPSAELYALSGGSNIDVKPVPDDAVAVDIGPTVFFAITTTVFIGIILFLLRSNRILQKRLRDVATENSIENVLGGDEDRITTPYEALDDPEEISSPLITTEPVEDPETQLEDSETQDVVDDN